jgi:hypothetical protein
MMIGGKMESPRSTVLDLMFSFIAFDPSILLGKSVAFYLTLLCFALLCYG